MPPREFLREVYALKDAGETRALYDAWADSYDDEIGRNGYATPGRIAEALAARIQDRNRPVLDFGCGTGLSGRALAACGFSAIDGCDVSPGMLAKAKEAGIYRRLWLSGESKLPHRRYAAIAAVGVISPGAAPPATLDSLLAGLAPGGLVGFSFNDHAASDPAYEARVAALLAAGQARQVLREAGPHLPGIGLGATIFVLERL